MCNNVRLIKRKRLHLEVADARLSFAAVPVYCSSGSSATASSSDAWSGSHEFWGSFPQRDHSGRRPRACLPGFAAGRRSGWPGRVGKNILCLPWRTPEAVPWEVRYVNREKAFRPDARGQATRLRHFKFRARGRPRRFPPARRTSCHRPVILRRLPKSSVRRGRPFPPRRMSHGPRAHVHPIQAGVSR